MNLLLEACVENFSGAVLAEKNGADRVELCDNLYVGGTTPSYGVIEMTRRYLSIPQAVIIRSRGGDFVYDDYEKRIMLKDIQLAEELQVAAVVVGALKENCLDKEFMAEARNCAKNSEIVCHMAFDDTADFYQSLDLLIELGYDRVLTKGGHGSASENIDTLKALVDYAGDRITILAGGGVNKSNVQLIAQNTGVTQLHGKMIV